MGLSSLWDTNYIILISNIYIFSNITWNGIIPGMAKSPENNKKIREKLQNLYSIPEHISRYDILYENL